MQFSQSVQDALLNAVFRATNYTAPTTVYAALHVAAKSTASAASAQNQIIVDTSIPSGVSVTIDPLSSLAPAETFTVNSVSGTGPYTLTLSGNLANTHPINSFVKFDFKDDGTGLNEATGGSYARVAATFSAPTHNADGSSQITNSGAVTFPASTAAWGLATHMFFKDASTAGNLLGGCALTTAQNIGTSNTPSFAASALTVKLD